MDPCPQSIWLTVSILGFFSEIKTFRIECSQHVSAILPDIARYRVCQKDVFLIFFARDTESVTVESEAYSCGDIHP